MVLGCGVLGFRVVSKDLYLQVTHNKACFVLLSLGSIRFHCGLSTFPQKHKVAHRDNEQ